MDKIETLSDFPNNEPLTIREVATHLRVNTATVHRWIRLGLLPVILLPRPTGTRRNYRIPRAEMDKVMQPLQPREEV